MRVGSTAIGRALGGSVLLLAAASCNIGEGIADLGSSLLDSPNSSFDSPGVQLFSGSFESCDLVDVRKGEVTLLLGEKQADGVHNLLLRVDWAQALLHPEDIAKNSKRCDLGLGSASFVGQMYGAADAGDTTESALVAVMETGTNSDSTTLQAFDRNCEPLGPPIAERYTRDTGVSLLVLDQAGALWEIDPTGPSVTQVLSGVQQVETQGERIYTLSDGVLTHYSADFGTSSVFSRAASDLYVGPSLIAFQNRGVLTIYDGTAWQSFFDACSPREANGSRAFAVLSPCKSRTLIVYPWNSGAVGGPIASAPAIDALETKDEVWTIGASGKLETQTAVRVLLTTSDGATTDYIFGDSTQTTVLGTNCQFTLNGAGTFFCRGDGVDGDLFCLRAPVSTTSPIAEHVVRFVEHYAVDRYGWLQDFDGAAATLHLDTEEGPFEVEGVPFSPTGNSAFDMDYGGQQYAQAVYVVGHSKDGLRGRLLLHHLDAATDETTTIDTDVHADSLITLWPESGEAYLRGDKATLAAHLQSSGLISVLHDHVKAAAFFNWPSPGLAYLVDSGADRGLWFSKLR